MMDNKKVGFVIGIILLGILIIGIFGNPFAAYGFERTYKELRALDSKYNTVMHTEQLGVMMVPFDNIIPMREELEELQKQIGKSRDAEGKKLSEELVKTRITMLDSQYAFSIAVKIGERGLVTDGFSCKEAETIAKSRIALLQSIKSAEEALQSLDNVLQEKIARPFIGTDENRPKFYDSPLRNIMFETNAQKQALLNCLKEAGMEIPEEFHKEENVV